MRLCCVLLDDIQVKGISSPHTFSAIEIICRCLQLQESIAQFNAPVVLCCPDLRQPD